jgi:uncharacterized protein YecT (DUF1311 family)
MPRLIRLAGIALVVVAVGWSQQTAEKKKTASPDLCPGAQTQMDITNCWENLAQKADANLNVVYQKVQKAIRAKIAQEQGPLKGYQERALEKLKAAELAWIHYREIECAAQEQQNEGGTIAPSIHAGCMKELADRRADDLQKTYAIYLLPQ